MKAIIYKKYGAPNVLHLSEVDTPVPKDNEVLIRIHAAEATKADCELRSFKFPVKWFWLPLRVVMGITKPKKPILGGYFAGQIISFGKNVTNFTKDSFVFGSSGFKMGAYGEYLCLPDTATIVEKPSNMSFEQAAAVPLGGFNALHFLTRANIKPGEKVLINGAGGSIGLFGVQIAKFMGAEVTAVDMAAKEVFLRDIGADHFVDYQQVDFTNEEQKYDVIFDMVAQSSYSRCVNSLTAQGRYLLGNPRISDMLRSIFTTRFSDKKVIVAFAGETKQELLKLKQMIENGDIKSVIDKTYPMSEAAKAHERVETEKRLGSIVISLTDK